MQHRGRKRGLNIALLMLVAVALYAAAHPYRMAIPDEEPAEKKLVYMRADRSYSIDVGDSMGVVMVGNFAALHNGAVITCDSAVRYSGQYIKCFGNVLINQNTTYVYGDRADYDGRINKAEVYSPLVKVIDGEATLYTRRFIFNTLEKVGEFDRGGVLFNQGNQLEAERGYYYTDDHLLACVGRVEMQDSTYQLRSDSVLYNTDTDYAYFFRNTQIWDHEGDYLEGDEGYYARPEERYVITREGYLLSEKNEVWSDSLDYYKQLNYAILHRNIQLDDMEQKAMGFGDYGEYYRDPGSAFLTRNPALVSYDTSQGADTLFLRADSILMLTTYTTQPEFNPWEPKREVADSTTFMAQELTPQLTESPSSSEETSSQSEEPQGDEAKPATTEEPQKESAEEQNTPTPKRPKKGDRNAALEEIHPGDKAREAVENQGDRLGIEGADTLNAPHPDPELQLADTLPLDSAALARQRLLDSLDTLSTKALKSYYKQIERERKDSVNRVKLRERNEKLAKIARARQAKITAQLNRMDSIEKARLERRRAKMSEKLERRRQKAIARGKELPDSSHLAALDSMILEKQRADSLKADSLLLDSLSVDSLAVDSLALDSLQVAPDTVRRYARGYRNVRIYRSDFQAVCDSIVGIGIDSTMHLYISPVLWNQQNQVSSDVMDVYTINQAIDHVDFVGHPILVTQIDTMYFNQISGKEMTAWFANNQIFRHDVDGNVETIYFLQDDPEAPVSSVFIIRSGTASFYMEDQQVVSMTYREQNEYSMMPMDKIPPTQELFLKEYKWMPERRPSRDSVLTRPIRPSARRTKEQLARPDFPLSEQILRQRDNLIEGGNWADRDETLTYEVIEWVRRNGFEPEQPRKEFSR